MIPHTLELKANADLPTSNLKRGNVQVADTGQVLTPMCTFLCPENVESAPVREYVGEVLIAQHQRHVQRQDKTAVIVPREGSQTPVKSLLELPHQTP